VIGQLYFQAALPRGRAFCVHRIERGVGPGNGPDVVHKEQITIIIIIIIIIIIACANGSL
jgi:hypothetical protein